jgi:hypothetical protein
VANFRNSALSRAFHTPSRISCTVWLNQGALCGFP